MLSANRRKDVRLRKSLLGIVFLGFTLSGWGSAQTSPGYISDDGWLSYTLDPPDSFVDTVKQGCGLRVFELGQLTNAFYYMFKQARNVLNSSDMSSIDTTIYTKKAIKSVKGIRVLSVGSTRGFDRSGNRTSVPYTRFLMEIPLSKFSRISSTFGNDLDNNVEHCNHQTYGIAYLEYSTLGDYLGVFFANGGKAFSSGSRWNTTTSDFQILNNDSTPRQFFSSRR